MSERIAIRQLCPVCGSLREDYAATVGHRKVWRCSHCERTFWPPRDKESVLLRLRTLLVGESRS